jgi:4-hydroxyacetophenone monooxygenase
MDIVGRSGVSLQQTWGDDARAYLGTAIADVPNFFCLYGPNAQFGHGGSLITIMDRQMHYVLSVLGQMFERGIGALVVRTEAHDAYNAKVDAAHDGMVWTHPGMDNYYRNSRGRVVAINPFRVVDFWGMTERADLDDYDTEPAREPLRSQAAAGR